MCHPVLLFDRPGRHVIVDIGCDTALPRNSRVLIVASTLLPIPILGTVALASRPSDCPSGS